jgi:hypothetical protein
MNIPIQPDSFSSQGPIGDMPVQVHKLLAKVSESTLAEQQAHLEAEAPRKSPRQVENMLQQHAQQLFSTLDDNATTHSLPESVKQSFVAEQIAQQRETYVNASQVTASSFKQAAEIENTALYGSDDPLLIDNVSVIEKTINGVTMYFPVARSSEGGGAYSPNESVGYYLRAFVNAGNKTAFQNMLNGLYFLMNQSNITRVQGSGSPMWDSWNEEGLTGWNLNISNLFSGNMTPYSSEQSGDLNTASDADEDIIQAMIDGYNKWGDMTATDPSSTGTGVISSSKNGEGQSTMNLSDMIKVNIHAFLSADFQTQAPNQNVLSGGDYQSGKGTPYADYFDPTVFAKMISFLQNNPSPPSDVVWNTVPQGGTPPPAYNAETMISDIKTDAKATWDFVSNLAAANGGWISNQQTGQGGVSAFGYEATRALMRMGQYMMYCKQTGSDPLGILQDQGSTPGVISTLKTLVSNLFSEGDFTPATIVDGKATSSINFTKANGGLPGGGFYGGAITGPLAVALAALQQAGQLPSDVTAADVTNVNLALQFDLGNYLHTDTYNPSLPDGGYADDWQEGGPDGSRGYFATCLAVLSQQIIDGSI